MDSFKLAAWPFILLALLLSSLFWAGAWLLEWWHWSMPVAALVSAILAFAGGGLCGWLCWWLRRRHLLNVPSASELAERQRLQYLQRMLLNDFDKVWRHQGRGGRGPYDTPWYFWVNESSDSDCLMLQQMGFEQAGSASESDKSIPVSFWLSDQAVLIGLHTGYDREVFDSCQDVLLTRLNSKRPRQPANGVLMTLPVSTLLESDQDQLKQITKQQRQLLQKLNQRLGLNLPIYALFTEMGKVKDFCQYFATFDDLRLEEPLGGMMPVTGRSGYDPDWFLSSFDKLQQILSAQVTTALRAQLSPEYRDSILAAPYQLELMRAELEDYFRQLFLDGQFEENVLNFRGYFFASAETQAVPVDRLTMLLASRLGFSGLPVVEKPDVCRSLFVKQLMSRGILPEASLVGVNRRREGVYMSLRVICTGGLAAVFVLFLWLLKANFDYYQAVDRQAVAQLDNYKQAMQASNSTPDDLAASTLNLSGLREIRQIYEQPTPWYVLSWLPNPSIGNAVDTAYRQELEQGLLIALRDYLVKDLYVYNSLNDKVHVLNLYNLHQLLYNPERANVDPLVEYYASSLQEEGEGDVVTLERFRSLIRDVLKPGVVPPESDNPLIELVRTSLSSEDLSELLYQHIMQQPRFSRRIDIRDQMGQSYQQVYHFTDGFSGYLTPYIFTRDGFLELMTGKGFQLTTTALKDYENIVGRISTEAELGRINRKLKRRYIEEYIGHWQQLVSHVHWRQTSGWADTRQQLEVVSEPLFSPLKRYYSLIAYHTNLADAIGEPDEQGEDSLGKLARQADTSGLADKAARLQAEARLLGQQEDDQRQSALRMAGDIAQPFAQYHRLIKLDDAGQSGLDVALRQITQTLEWIRQATLNQVRGRFFLDQLVAGENMGPLAQMQTLSQSYSDALVRDLLYGNAEQLNQLAMSDVRMLLNSYWSQDVMAYYNNRIKRFYPFNMQAGQEVGLGAFKEFFGPDGLVAAFNANYLGHFRRQDGRNPVLQSFLPGQVMVLDKAFWDAMYDMASIRDTFFREGNIGLQFSLRAQAMGAGMTEFSLRGSGPVYLYRNGPALWTRLSWPMPDVQSRKIEMKLTGREHVVDLQTYEGVWSWFRLVDALNGTRSADNVTTQLVAGSGQNIARLQVSVDEGINPFVAGFFAGLHLPEWL